MNKQKSTESAKAGQLDPSTIPTATETTPINIGVGTFQVAGNQLWFGDEDSQKIVTKIKTGGVFGFFESTQKQEVGFQYFLGMQIGVCQAYDNATVKLLQWRIKNEVLFSNTTENGSFRGSVNNKSFMGDFEGGAGGYQGEFDWYDGSNEQTPNDYLITQVGDNIPAYNRLAYFVWRRGYHGNAETPDSWTFVVKRIIHTSWSTPSKDEINGSVNPACYIYEILTNPEFGLSMSDLQIDLVNFKEVHEKLYDEQLGISEVITSDVDAKTKLNQILQIIDAQFNTNTPKIQIKLNRDDYVIDDLEVIDGDKIINITNDSVGSLTSIANEVKVKYTDINNDFKSKYAIAQNNGVIFERNRIETVILDYPAVTDPVIANQIAARELIPLTTPLRKCQITVTHTDKLISVGDVVIIDYEDEDYNKMLMRVTEVNYGNVNSSKIVLTLAQDKFGVNKLSIFNPNPSNTFTPPDYTALPANLRLLEAPYYFNNQETDLKVITYATKPSKSHLNYELWTKSLEAPEYIYQSRSEAFTPAGSISEGFIETSNIIKVTNDFDMQIITNNTSDSLKSGYNTALIVEDSMVEFINFSNISIVSGVYILAGVNRALFDTIPREFSTDAKIYFISYGFAINDNETYSLGQTINMKALTKTVRRTLDLDDAPVTGLTLIGRKRLPIVVSNLKLSGEEYKKVVEIGDEDLILTYSNRDRKNEVQYYDDDVSVNVNSNVFRITIYDNSTNTLLKNFTTSSLSYIFDDEKTLNAGQYFSSLRVVIKTEDGSFASLYEYDIIVNRL